MPELPECETIIRGLREQAIGYSIVGIAFKEEITDNILQSDPTILAKDILNQYVETVLRKGKYIIFILSEGYALVVHLGMTGRLTVDYPDTTDLEQKILNGSFDEKNTHMILEFECHMEDGHTPFDLYFADPRRFGKIWFFSNVNDLKDIPIPSLQALGPDALSISPEILKKIMSNKKTVKSVLLDQSNIAGIGNIYADESCHLAGIHPRRQAGSLTDLEIQKLSFAVKNVLTRAIHLGGSSISDYVNIDGNKGSFQKEHRVYSREGKPCVQCSAEIERIKIVGRSTYFCPACQPLEKSV